MAPDQTSPGGDRADDGTDTGGHQRSVGSPRGDLTVRGRPSDRETAAIAAALAEYLDEPTDDQDEAVESWDGKRFRFAGRIDGVMNGPRRVPRGAPTDNWTAAGRADRFKR
jgi:hypothetical protein